MAATIYAVIDCWLRDTIYVYQILHEFFRGARRETKINLDLTLYSNFNRAWQYCKREVSLRLHGLHSRGTYGVVGHRKPGRRLYEID